MRRRIIGRIQVLNNGKGHYLDFLRNLTPQALLLSFVFVAGSKLTFSAFDCSNWFQTAVFYVLLLGFLAAAYANISNFREKCFRGLVTWNRRVKILIGKKDIKKSKQLFAILAATFSRKSVEFIEFLVVSFLFPILLVVVLVAAFNSATIMLKKG